MAEDDDRRLTHLRAAAHPVRLRIMSILTAEAMSAAEVARALEITHANASYHLRRLHDAGDLVIESEEKVRGGVAKRYRYDVGAGLRSHDSPTPQARITDARATAAEIERRLRDVARGPSTYSDLETWIPVDVWHRALDMMLQASRLLHTEARPPGTSGTVHVSATSQAFTMSGGLTGEDVRWQR